MVDQLVIFVHGLGGSAETWRGFPELLDADQAVRAHFDFLYHEYATGGANIPFRRVENIKAAAEALATIVQTKARQYKKIFLVAHSLGGLVVRRAIIHLLDLNHAPLIAGIAFFACPHRGSLLAKIADAYGWGTSQVEALAPDSEVIEHIHAKWEERLAQLRFPTIDIIGADDHAVDTNSVRGRPGAEFFVRIPGKDHRAVCKPQSLDDLSYTALRNFLFGRIEAIPNLDINDDGSPFFSPAIRKHFERLKRTVERLTEVQLELINDLRGMNRVATQGCAGSGKTMVAAEKALRLHRSGRRVLILCHSPNLAQFIAQLSQPVQALSFHEWIDHLTGSAYPLTWQPGHEPATDVIREAIKTLAQLPANKRYDDIIVDEGQDFRDSWWEVVLAALKSKEDGGFFVFYDEMQRVYPHSGNMPANLENRELNKNCRNGGEIFDIIAKLNPDAPLKEKELAPSGRFIALRCPGNAQYRDFLQVQLEHLFQVTRSDDIAVITSDQDDNARQWLDGMTIEIPYRARWQNAVAKWMADLREKLGSLPGPRSWYHHLAPAIIERGHARPFMKERDAVCPIPPTLSNRPYPTDDDVRSVQDWAGAALALFNDLNVRSTAGWGKSRPPEGDSAIEVRRDKSETSYNRTNNSIVDFVAVLRFLEGDWRKGLPKPRTKTIRHYSCCTEPDMVPLYDVEAIKGLEKEVIIYTLPEAPAAVEEKLYIGISRARALAVVLLGPKFLVSEPRATATLGASHGDLGDLI